VVFKELLGVGSYIINKMKSNVGSLFTHQREWEPVFLYRGELDQCP
jgi:hypothetical protein